MVLEAALGKAPDNDTDDAEARKNPSVVEPEPNSVPENKSASSANSVSICAPWRIFSDSVGNAGRLCWLMFCSRGAWLLVSVTVMVGMELEDEVVVKTDEVVLDLPRLNQLLLFVPSASCSSRSTCA